MRIRAGGLWQNPDFMKLWVGETISLFGTQITVLALPLVAANTLQATPAQMGTLGYAQYIPWLLVGLVAGVWVDRLRRRPIMIIADLGRAVLLGFIPLAALSGVLRMEHLYLIGFLVGIGNVFFDIAYVAFLPGLLSSRQLVEGNSKLQSSASASEVAGPGLAGILTQILSAPFAMLLDACSFLASAVLLWWIRTPEMIPAHSTNRPSVLQEARDGLRLVLRHRLLRGFVGCSTMGNIAIDMHLAVYILYLTRELGVGASTIGLFYAFGGIGGLIGAALSNHLVKRLGAGRATVFSQLSHGLCLTAIPLAGLLGGLALPFIGLAHFVWGLTVATYAIPAVSLRQAIAPVHLQGRITASQRVLTFGISPIGFLIGGLLGEWLGLWPTLVLAGLVLILSNLWVSLSPLPRIQDVNVLPQELVIVEP